MYGNHNCGGELAFNWLGADKMANYRNLNAKYANKLREDIKAMMDEQGILLTELADKANIEKSVLRNYINGRNDINSGNLIAVLKVLGNDLHI